MQSDAAHDDGALRELADLRLQQHAISRVLRARAASAGLQTVLDEIVEACRRLCNADNAAMWLLESDGLLHSVAHQGEPGGAAFDRDHPHAVDRSTAAGRTALARRAVHIPDVEADPEYAYAGPRAYRAMLGVPILFEAGLMGVVVVVRHLPQPFGEDDITLLRTFADQAAVALANARLIDAVERQRGELARFISPQVADLIAKHAGECELIDGQPGVSCCISALASPTKQVPVTWWGGKPCETSSSAPASS